MLYNGYRAKLQKRVKFLGMLYRFRILIISVIAFILAAIATLLTINGIVYGDLTPMGNLIAASGDTDGANYTVTYGSDYSFSGTAIMHKTTYQYSAGEKDDNGEWSWGEWTDEKPVLCGTYRVRAVSRRTAGYSYGEPVTYKISRLTVYVAVAKVEVKNDSGNTELKEGVTYREMPTLKYYTDSAGTDELVFPYEDAVVTEGDDAFKYEYEDYSATETYVTLSKFVVTDQGGNKVYSNDGIKCYDFKAVEATSDTNGTESSDGEITRYITFVKRPITIELKDIKATYGGSVRNPNPKYDEDDLEDGDVISKESISGYYVTLDNGQQIDYNNAKTSPVDVGTYAITASVKIFNGEKDVTINYDITVTGSLEIEPRPVTVTTDSCSWTYDGEEHSATYSVTEELDSERDEGLLANDSFNVLSQSSVSTVTEGEVASTLTYKIYSDKGEDVTSNYNVTTDWGTLTITKRKVTLTTADGEWTYDGTSHVSESCTASEESGNEGLISSQSVTATGYASVVNVNQTEEKNNKIESYTIFASDGSTDVTENYNVKVEYGTLTIKARSLTIKTDSKEFEYNGEAQSYTHFTWSEEQGDEGLLKGQSVSVNEEASVAAITNVAEGEVQNSFGVVISGENYEEGDYAITYEYGTLSMYAVTYGIEIGNKKKTYNGTSQTVTSDDFKIYKLTKTSGSSIKEYVDKDKILGGCTLRIVLETSENATDPGETVSVKVKSVDFIKIVDGKEEVVGTFSNGGVSSSGTSQSSGNTIYKAGVYSKKSTFADSGFSLEDLFENYNFEFVVVDDNGDVVEDGDPTAGVTMTIVKRQITVKTAGYSGVYDGAAHSDTSVEVTSAGDDCTLLDGHTIGINKNETAPSVTDVADGTVSNEFSISIYDGNGNDITSVYYEIVDAEYGTLAVTKRPIKIDGVSENKVYDGANFGLTEKNCYTLDTATEYSDGVAYMGVAEGQILTVKYNDISEVQFADGDNLIVKSVDTLTGWDITANGSSVKDNYDVSFAAGTLTITKRPIAVTALGNSDDGTNVRDGKEVIYDGTEHTYETSYDKEDKSAIENDSGLLSIHTLSGSKSFTNAGSYENDLTVDITDSNNSVLNNYAVTYTREYVIITPATVTITAETYSETYNAETKYIGWTATYGKNDFETTSALYNGATFIVENSSFQAIHVSDTGATDVGAVTITLSDGTSHTYSSGETYGNYIVSTIEGSINITAKALSIKTEDKTFTYNGEAQYHKGYTQEGLITGHTIAVTSDTKITNVSESGTENKLEISVSGTNYEVGDYAISYTYGTLTMNARPIAVTALGNSDDGTNVRDGKEVIYDGTEHTYETSYDKEDKSATENDSGLLSIHTLSGSKSFTNAGSYENDLTVTITDSNNNSVLDNYAVTYTREWVIITPATVTITAESYSGVYNAETKYIGWTLELTSNSGTTTTTYTDTVGSLCGDDKVTVTTGKFQAIHVDDSKTTDVGTATVTNDLASNYNITTKTGSISITAVSVTITSNTNEWVYDGKTHTDPECAPTVLLSDHKVNVSSSTGITNVSESGCENKLVYTIVGTNYADNDYKITNNWGTLTITPANLVITAGSSTGNTYNGKAVTVTWKTKLNNDNPVTQSANTATICSDALTIGVKNSAALSATNAGTHTTKVGTVTIATGGNTYTLSSGAATYAAAMYAKNYNITIEDGKIEIGKATLVITAGSSTAGNTYDGTAKGVTWTTKLNSEGSVSHTSSETKINLYGDGTNYDTLTINTDNDALLSATNAGTCITTVGSYTITPMSGGTEDNYTVTENTGTLTITPANLVITAGSYGTEDNPKTYDGTDHTSEVGWSMTLGGNTTSFKGTKNTTLCISADTLTVATASFTAKDVSDSKDTNVGTVTIVTNNTAYSISSSSNNGATGNAVNYTVTIKTGTIKITPASLTITAGSYGTEDNPETYDGQSHELTWSATLAGKTDKITQTANALFEGATVSVTTDTKTVCNVSDTGTFSVGTVTITLSGGTYYTLSNDTNHTISGTVQADDDTYADGAYTIGNYKVTITDGKINITQRPITITRAGTTGTVYYNGTERSYDFEWEKEGKDKGLLTSLNHTATGYSETSKGSTYKVTNAGTYTNDIEVKIKDGNGADVTDNYDISYAGGKIKITPASLKITAGSGSKTYDGTALSVSWSATLAKDTNDSRSYTYSENGTYTLYGSDTFTVANNTYSATNVCDTTFSVGTVTITVDGTATTYSSGEAKGNYKVTITEGKIKITPASLTITAGSGSKTYDGTAVTAGWDIEWNGTKTSYTYAEDTKEVNLYPVSESATSHDTLSVAIASFTATNVKDTGATDVGMVKIVTNNTQYSISSSSNNGATGNAGNYTVTIKTGAITINAREITVTAIGNSEDGITLKADESKLYYDGENHHYTEAELTSGSLVDGHVTTYDFSGITGFIDAGNHRSNEYDVTIKSGEDDVTSNYKINKTSEYVVIALRPIKIDGVTKSKVYDGTDFGLTADGCYTLDTATEYSDGVAYMNVVEGQILTVTFNDISKVQLENGEVISEVTLTGCDITANGSSVKDNYYVKFAAGSLTITKRPITFEAGSYNGVYDGEEHYSEELTLTSGSYALATHTAKADVNYLPKIQDVGEEENSYETKYITISDGTDNVTANYDITLEKGTLKVTKRPVTLTTGDASKVYSGTPLTNENCSASATDTGTGIASGQTISYSNFAGITDVGSIKNSVTYVIYASDGTTKVTNNYEVTEVWGTLTVTKRSITISTGTCEFVYNGNTESYSYGVLSWENLPDALSPDVSISDFTTITNSEFGAEDQNVERTNVLTYEFTIYDASGNVVSEDNFDITCKEGTISVYKPEIYIRTATTEFFAETDENGNAVAQSDPSLASFDTSMLAEGHTYNGYTYGEYATVSTTDDGVKDNVLEDLKISIIDEDGNDVTDWYFVEISYGTLQIVDTPTLVFAPVSAEFIYDGAEHSSSEVDLVSGKLAKGHTFVVTDQTGVPTITAVGSAVNYFTYTITIYENYGEEGQTDVTSKYNVEKMDTYDECKVYIDEGIGYGLLEVRKAKIYSVETATENFTCDGEAHSDDTVTITKGDGLLTGHSFKTSNVPTVQALGESKSNVFDFTIVDANGKDVTEEYYDLTEMTITYGVIKIKPEIKIETPSGTWMYDGSAHSISDDSSTEADERYTIADGELNEGDSIVVTYVTSVTDYRQGGYSNAITIKILDSDGNDVTTSYTVTYTTGTLTITQRPILVVAPSATKEYDGTPLSATDIADPEEQMLDKQYYTLADGHSIVFYATSTYPTITDVGTITNKFGSVTDILSGMNYSIVDADGNDVTSNYSISHQYGRLEVTARKITITTESHEFSYDDDVHYWPKYEVTSGSLVEGDGIVVASYTTVSQQGDTAENVLGIEIRTKDGAGDDVTSNYDITFINGTLSITTNANTIVINVKPVDIDREYSGSALTYDNCGLEALKLIEGVDEESQSALDYLLNKLEYTYKATFSGSQTEKGFSDGYIVSLTFKNYAGSDCGTMFEVPDKGTNKTYIIKYTGNAGTIEVTEAQIVVTFTKINSIYSGESYGYTYEDWYVEDETITLENGETVGIEYYEENIVMKENTIYVQVANVEEICSTDVCNLELTYDLLQEFGVKVILWYEGADVTDNYYIKTEGTFVISKREITIATGSAIKEYDGTELTCEEYEITAGTLAAGDELVLYDWSSQLETGSAKNEVNATILNGNGEDVTENYEILVDPGALSVT